MRLIVNADDFGLSGEINRAVLRAHREGILTSASVMAGGAAFDEAVAMARENPRLSVGLHVVVVDGPAVLPVATIPNLVDARGMFPASAVRVGLEYVISGAARRELEAELRAQFERFAATGLKLAHVNGHQHMHLHPVVFAMLLPLMREFGAGGIRIPRDDLSLSLKTDRRMAGTKMAWTAVFGLLSRWCSLRLRGQGFFIPDRTYGFMQTGQMGERYVLSVLREMRAPVSEIYFHPTTGPRHDYSGANPDDLRTLLSAEVRQIVGRRGLRLSAYGEVSCGKSAW